MTTGNIIETIVDAGQGPYICVKIDDETVLILVQSRSFDYDKSTVNQGLKHFL